MTTTLQATGHKPDNFDADRRIQGLCGPGWSKGIDTIIFEIENGLYRYWTTSPQRQAVWVQVSKRANGRKYLKTEADGVEPNNLLALPHCP